MARLLVVLLLMLLALFVRLIHLDPAGSANHDEGVYASAAQLLLHGVLPYRDYFHAHPPGGVLLLSPAMLIDSSAWGGPDAFLAARLLSMAYSLVSVGLAFAIGHLLAGWWGAVAAALVWSLDERVVSLSSQAMLDVPMAMLSFGGILAYLAVRPASSNRLSSRDQVIGVAIAGGLTALATLTKVVGVTALLAILADLVWRQVVGRPETVAPWRLMGSLLLGAGTVFAVVLAPFAAAAPGEVLRQSVFFQLLRPYTEVGPIERISRLAERPEHLPTLVMAGLGLTVLALLLAVRFGFSARNTRLPPWVARVRPGGWSVILLWTGLNVVTYLSTRAFHPQYQLHLLAPLALLAAGAGLLPRLLWAAPRSAGSVRPWELAALGLVILALGAQQALRWDQSADPPDPEHVAMSRHLRDAVPAESAVFTLDARVTFLAGREPSLGPIGYLVDPYGHLVYVGLDLADRSPADLLDAVVRGEERSWAAVVGSPSSQDHLIARFRDANLVIVHENEQWRLGSAAMRLQETADHVDRLGRYLLYAMP